MIFDGVPSLGQLPASFNMHNLSTRRNASLSTAVANQTLPTILNVESPPSSLIWLEMKVPLSLAIMRRRSQMFVKGTSLRSLLPSTSSQVQTSSSKNQHITSMNHQWSSTPPDGGAVQEFFSSLPQLFLMSI